MKGIYLAAYKAYHPNYNIVYQDINGLRDLAGNMLEIDLSEYDFIIATPPCNFWSHARGNRQPSNYAMKTAHLLPEIILKLQTHYKDKLFIIENVRNKPKFEKYNLIPNNNLAIYTIGLHTYWTNTFFNPYIEQEYDFININGSCKDLKKDRQGGLNVHRVIERWLFDIHNNYHLKIY